LPAGSSPFTVELRDEAAMVETLTVHSAIGVDRMQAPMIATRLLDTWSTITEPSMSANQAENVAAAASHLLGDLKCASILSNMITQM
jgi:hypothetical protein